MAGNVKLTSTKLTGCANRLDNKLEGAGASCISAAGFNADEGLAERDMSIGDDLGLSETSSIRGLSKRMWRTERSDSLEGDELLVVILSLSRKLPLMSSASPSPSPSVLVLRSLPLLGSVKVFERGELTRGSSPNHRLLEKVGRRIRFRSGVESSLDCIESSMKDGDDELEDNANSDRDVGRKGRGGVEAARIVESLDDDGGLPESVDRTRVSSSAGLLAILSGRSRLG